MSKQWKEAQNWESSWWGDCINTLGEEIKQIEYAKLMGLDLSTEEGKLIIKSDKSILDIGGGPVSLLLKTKTNKRKVVVEPLAYPDWVYQRYILADVEVLTMRGEDISDIKVDEVWIYNCLQHVENWERIIENARRSCKILRIFEWVEIPTNIGHIHMLTKDELDRALGQDGFTKEMNQNGCNGLAYFNVIDYEQNF